MNTKTMLINPRVYYAHSMHLYNTIQETRDIETLQSMGFEVLNPNCTAVQKDVDKVKEMIEAEKQEAIERGYTIVNGTNVMDLFKNYIDTCDLVAYRSHVDLRIPSGVMFEVDYAVNTGKTVFELPTLTNARRMTHVETIEYLKYNGQR